MLRLPSVIWLAFAISFPCISQNLDGVWGSDGYGYVFDVHGTVMQAFEVTAATCVPGFSARRDSTPVTGREATFRDSNDVYFIRTGGTDDHRLLHRDGAASDIRIRLLPRKPAVCDTPTPNTPIGNFEVFARTWAENYISFNLKHADWDRVVAENRAKITSQTTPQQLFDVFRSMIEPFGDAHTSIVAGDIKRIFVTLRPGTDRVVTESVGSKGIMAFYGNGVPKILATTDRLYFHNRLRAFCNGQIQYGHIDEGTGYLRITSFQNYAKGGFGKGLDALEAALDQIFSDVRLHSLIIDLRINFGGEDPYGLAIASRLATGGYLAYTKQARADAVRQDAWTPGDPSVVRPSPRPGFHGPVVLLTGPLTISAGETFTQALMGRTPHVTRVGESTQGVFSDVLERRLPNGWRFGLPNEVYLTPDGKTFDGPGIPPEVDVPVFSARDIAAGKDPAMAKALAMLQSSE
jgi:hypothetical protein